MHLLLELTDVLQIRRYGLRYEIRFGVSEVSLERYSTFFVCFTASSTMVTFGVQMTLVKSVNRYEPTVSVLTSSNVILSHILDATINTVKISTMQFLKMFTKAATLQVMKDICTLH
jgi:hypothetical protein